MQTLHVNLVSEQLTANLIPTLVDKNCVGVILVLGDSTLKQQAKTLTEIYEEDNYKIFKTSHGESSFETTALKRQADELIKYLANEHNDKRWVLNATGGTKPMSLAMTLAFQEYNTNLTNGQNSIDIIYTDTQNNTIHYFNRSQHLPLLQYNSVLDLKKLSTVNGFAIDTQTNQSNDENIVKRANLTEYLAEQYSSEPTILNILQETAKHYRNGKKTYKIPENSISENSTTSLHEVLQRLHNENLIVWEKSSIKIESKKNGTYLSGGWLEEFTYLQALQCGFDEISINVHGIWNKDNQQNNSIDGKDNEFDLLIAHNNQLLIIECKACPWDKKNKDYNNQDPLHKLDALGSKLGGIYKQNLLISFYPITDAMRNRLSDKKIKLCDNLHEIANTLKQLRKIMNNE